VLVDLAKDLVRSHFSDNEAYWPTVKNCIITLGHELVTLLIAKL